MYLYNEIRKLISHLITSLIMAQKKDFKFPSELTEAAQFHFALSHPARLHIIETLKKNGPASFEQLTHGIPLHRATITQHITILKRTQLITSIELPNATVGYCINGVTYTHLQQILSNRWASTA